MESYNCIEEILERSSTEITYMTAYAQLTETVINGQQVDEPITAIKTEQLHALAYAVKQCAKQIDASLNMALYHLMSIPDRRKNEAFVSDGSNDAA